MYKQKVVLGVAPTKRSFLSMEEAKRQKDKFMARIRAIKPEAVEIIELWKNSAGSASMRFFFHSAILVKNR